MCVLTPSGAVEYGCNKLSGPKAAISRAERSCWKHKHPFSLRAYQAAAVMVSAPSLTQSCSESNGPFKRPHWSRSIKDSLIKMAARRDDGISLYWSAFQWDWLEVSLPERAKKAQEKKERRRWKGVRGRMKIKTRQGFLFLKHRQATNS